ncbi:hypothetical protein Bbelb_159660 [Xyrichtys novacula]|uniref:Reverse transcriptase domain-containing protein n=1 Tax=Xyrichtys novacula TaxID=13765 RepID=A0AAV1F9H9_XYRNO|nr:hypothetical protein Bbelb_159660 [Xyrichtys novacula]
MEHFKDVLNQPTPSILFNFDQETPAPPLNASSEEITRTEIAEAIKSLKNNKTPGPDEVTTELLKHGQEVVVEGLKHLFNRIWHAEEFPANWRRGVIVTLPKKGNLADCNNWRRITLLSIPCKVFCCVLLKCLKDEVDTILREDQAGFREGRSCSERIFTLRNIKEQCQEFQIPLTINYINFKKAFDSIHQESLWHTIQLYCIPPKYVKIIRALYHNSTCRVKTTNGKTNDFNIVTGVRQGCILSPLLFITVIDFVMRKTVIGANHSIKWGGGRLADLDFADDLALFSHTHVALKELTNNLHEQGAKVGLRISQEKTKAMTIAQHQHLPPLTIGEQDIEYIKNFTYLGSNVSNTGHVEKDVQTRIGKAARVFQ